MERNTVIAEKVIARGKHTVKFQKETGNKNHVEVFFLDDEKGLIKLSSFYVARDLGNHWYKNLKATPEGCDLTPLLDIFFLDSVAFDDDYDFYSDIFKDIYGRRPHYTKEQWENRVNAARSLKPEAVVQ